MDIDGLKVVELKAKLNELGLSIKGNKTELVKRLKDHFYAADAAPVTATSTTTTATTSDATAATTSDATAASTTTTSDATTSTTVPSPSIDASPPIDACDDALTESDDRSDDSSSGFVYQKTGLDDTDALSNATDALEDEVTVHNEQPSKKRSTGKVYSPYLSFKRVDIAEKTLQGSFLDGTWKRLNTTDSLLPALVRQSVEPSNAGIIEKESEQEPKPEEESTRKKKKHTNEAPKRVQRRQSKRH